MKGLQPRARMLVLTGSCFILSWLIGLSSTIASMEAHFYQQLLQLTPAFQLAVEIEVIDLPVVIHQLLLVLMFSLIIVYQFVFKRLSPVIGFIIPMAFTLLMAEVLLAVMQQVWLPALWPAMAFSLRP